MVLGNLNSVVWNRVVEVKSLTPDPYVFQPKPLCLATDKPKQISILTKILRPEARLVNVTRISASTPRGGGVQPPYPHHRKFGYDWQRRRLSCIESEVFWLRPS
jgi:hypothetical protein